MKSIILAFLMIFMIHISWSQKTISGTILDESNKPLDFVSVSLLSMPDSSLVKGELTDNQGKYIIPDVPSGSYIILASYIGYSNLYSKDFTLKDENNAATVDLQFNQAGIQLKETVISAKKPFLEQRADRLIVNVANSPVAAGRTALEILKKVPGIIVMQDKISLGGTQSVQIWIDGKPSPYQDMTSLLRDMPGDQIDRIELIKQPGAQFDAAGGPILNVVLRRDANLGFRGSVGLTLAGMRYDQTQFNDITNDYGRINPNVNLTYRNGKINLFANGTLNTGSYFEGILIDRYIQGDIYKGINLTKSQYSYRSTRFGGDYYLTKKSTLGAVFRIWGRNGSDNGINTTTAASLLTPTQIRDKFITENKGEDNGRGTLTSLNYRFDFDEKKERYFTFDADYNYIMTASSNDLTIFPVDTPLSRSQSKQKVSQPVNLYVLKSDYVHPIDSTFKLSVGAKSSWAEIDNGLNFERGGKIVPGESNNFLYNENINSAYANLNKNIGKFELSAGLRTEQTIAKGYTDDNEVLDRNYTQWFPSGSSIYKLNEHMAIAASYTKRINRPSFNQQNPFTFFIDSLTYTRGNPKLRPEINDNMQLNFTYDGQPVLGINYSKTADVIVRNAPQIEGSKTFTTAQNLANNNRLEIQLNFPIKLGKYIDGFGGNQFIRNGYKADYEGTKFEQAQWNWLAYWQITGNLGKDWKAEVSGFYMTKFLDEFFTIDPIVGIDLGLSKTSKDKKHTVSLSFDDILYSQNAKARIDFNSIKVDFQSFQYNRNLRLTYKYNFGNDKVKNINKTSASESESSRVKID